MISLVTCFFLSLFLGIYIHYALAIVFCGIFIISLAVLIIRNKFKKNDNLLLEAHLCLALALRAENSNYLKKYIKLRPGYQARWIEVHFL
jgi:hypothetical protein